MEDKNLHPRIMAIVSFIEPILDAAPQQPTDEQAKQLIAAALDLAAVSLSSLLRIADALERIDASMAHAIGARIDGRG